MNFQYLHLVVSYQYGTRIKDHCIRHNQESANNFGFNCYVHRLLGWDW